MDVFQHLIDKGTGRCSPGTLETTCVRVASTGDPPILRILAPELQRSHSCSAILVQSLNTACARGQKETWMAGPRWCRCQCTSRQYTHVWAAKQGVQITAAQDKAYWRHMAEICKTGMSADSGWVHKRYSYDLNQRPKSERDILKTGINDIPALTEWCEC